MKSTLKFSHPVLLLQLQVTRFAGRAREMGRILRLKADLQQVVVSAEYAAQTFSAPSVDGDADNNTHEPISSAMYLV